MTIARTSSWRGAARRWGRVQKWKQGSMHTRLSRWSRIGKRARPLGVCRLRRAIASNAHQPWKYGNDALRCSRSDPIRHDTIRYDNKRPRCIRDQRPPHHGSLGSLFRKLRINRAARLLLIFNGRGRVSASRGKCPSRATKFEIRSSASWVPAFTALLIAPKRSISILYSLFRSYQFRAMRF